MISLTYQVLDKKMNKNNIITALLIIAVAALVAIEFSIVASMQQQKRLEQKIDSIKGYCEEVY